MSEDTNLPKFSDFAKSQPQSPVTVDRGTVQVDPTTTDDQDLPALFATIHHQSADRPNGYTPEDIEALNNAANAHLPHLQTKQDEDE